MMLKSVLHLLKDDFLLKGGKCVEKLLERVMPRRCWTVKEIISWLVKKW